MPGGTWTTQNKTRPGVYINFVGEGKPVGAVGERGIVTMPLSLSWGPAKQVITINAGDNLAELLGYDITAPQLLLVREALKRAKTLLLYRLNEGTKAKVTAGALTATAKYGGVRGNDTKMVIQKNIDDDTMFDVTTVFAGQAVELQLAKNVEDLKPNRWVDFGGTGALEVTAGAPLVGGTDGTTTNEDHTKYLTAIEVYEWNAMALPSTDSSLKAVHVSFVKRLRDKEGVKVQLAIENYPTADYEGVISVKNGVVLSDGTTLTAAQATVWVAAASAAANVNESLTYTAYDDAVDVEKRYTNSQIEAALLKGEFIFVANNGRAVVEQDINTFTSFTPEKGKQFSKNRVIRVLDSIGNDLKRIFEKSYIGKVNNNEDGRSLFRAQCTTYLNTLQNISAIQNFDPQTDVSVYPGNEVDSVYCELVVQPVDAIEKIYMKVKVK
ncbi:phage tail sheath family protein [Paenibacillus alvei]|uniref:Putative phage tail sheath protein skin element n=1 Tax=Paenibacillus alvei TaxID=44250 RepID=A0A383RE63_PAEAL|nr:phage tail sheath family protein [Paenibacillus alvei]SYX84609.1 putative phage tail sheath protein; skin element [Paenibacillus alvei]